MTSLNKLYKFIIKCLYILTICLPSAKGHQKLMNITIFHMNDINCNVDEVDSEGYVCLKTNRSDNQNCYGGLYRISKMVNNARQEFKNGKGPPILVFNAGNTLAPVSYCFGKNIENLMWALNAIKINAMGIGPKDLSFGIDKFLGYTKNLTAPILALNVLRKIGTFKSKIINLAQLKIGVIGYIIPSSIDLRYPNVTLLDSISLINIHTLELKNKQVKTIIALGYADLEMHRLVAYGCPDVDLIIGGSKKVCLWNGPDQLNTKIMVQKYPLLVHHRSGKIIPIVTACTQTKFIGKINVQIDRYSGEIANWKGNLRLLKANISEDVIPNQFRLDVSNVRQRTDWRETEERKKDLYYNIRSEIEGGEKCLKRECSMGSLMTYEMSCCKSLARVDEERNYLALMPGKYIKKSLYIGKILHQDLQLAIDPDNCELTVVVVKGADIPKIFERSVKNYGKEGYDEFLQTDRVHVSFDMRRKPGKRLRSIEIRNLVRKVPVYGQISIEKTYEVVVPVEMLYKDESFSWFMDFVHEVKKDHKSTLWGCFKEYKFIPNNLIIFYQQRITVIGSSGSKICSSYGEILTILTVYVLIK